MSAVAASPLDNVFWETMVGPQAPLSTGVADARRYAPGFSPIIGFADPRQPNLGGLAPYCQAGERFYCDGWDGPVPRGWELVLEKRMSRMVMQPGIAFADDAPEARRLGPGDAAQALDLAIFTNPGPFGLRTIELGEYFGLFEDGRLVAMAGERMHAGEYREVSGICTHPDRQGRGYAGRLTAKVLQRQLARGQVPFLHVMSANAGARALYEKMGFRLYRETVVRVTARTAHGSE